MELFRELAESGESRVFRAEVAKEQRGVTGADDFYLGGKVALDSLVAGGVAPPGRARSNATGPASPGAGPTS